MTPDRPRRRLKIDPIPPLVVVKAGRPERLQAANELIEVIASCGRRFFRNDDDGFISRLEADHRGRIWFIDDYSKRRVYTHYRGCWRGFTSGGTLRSLIECLRDHVLWGTKFVGGTLGRHWAYGDDIQAVRDAASRLGIAFDGDGQNRSTQGDTL